MASVLLISTEEVKKYTILNGNLDPDEFIQYIKISQDISIQGYLGTDLYNKLQELILDGTINDVGNLKYKTLLNSYVKPMLIHWTMVYYLPFSAYKIQNKGVFKHSSENAQVVEKNEIDYLVEKERDIAEHYTQRFIEHMRYNVFSEYNSNTNEDVYPNKTNYFGGWEL